MLLLDNFEDNQDPQTGAVRDPALAKALELLGGWLEVEPERLPGLLGHLQEALGYVDAALAAEDQEHGRALLLDAVLADVPEQRQSALEVLAGAQQAWGVLGQEGNAQRVGRLIAQVRGLSD